MFYVISLMRHMACFNYYYYYYYYFWTRPYFNFNLFILSFHSLFILFDYLSMLTYGYYNLLMNSDLGDNSWRHLVHWWEINNSCMNNQEQRRMPISFHKKKKKKKNANCRNFIGWWWTDALTNVEETDWNFHEAPFSFYKNEEQ